MKIKELKKVPPLTPQSLFFAKASLASATLSIVLLVLLHLLKPDLNPSWQFISEYALGDYGWMMILTFFAFGASLFGSFFAIRTQVKTFPGYIGLFLLALSGIGYFIAGIFPTDPITTPMDEMTFDGQMHSFGAMLDWLPVAGLLIGLSLSRSIGWAAKRKSLFVMAVIMIVLMFAFIGAAASTPDGQFGPGSYAGLIGRFNILSYFCWIAIVTKHTLTIARAPDYEQQN